MRIVGDTQYHNEDYGMQYRQFAIKDYTVGIARIH